MKKQGLVAGLLSSVFIASGVWLGGNIERQFNKNDFNEAVNQLKDSTIQISSDTSHTADGKIADIKSDTTYVLTKADFDKLKP